MCASCPPAHAARPAQCEFARRRIKRESVLTRETSARGADAPLSANDNVEHLQEMQNPALVARPKRDFSDATG